MDTIDTAPVSAAPAPSPAPSAEPATTTSTVSAVQEAPTPAPASPASTATQGEEVIASGGSNENGKRFQLVKDASGRRVVKLANEAPAPAVQEEPVNQEPVTAEEPAASVSQDVETAVENVNKELPKYNLNEFSHAIAMGNVDESRVPAEFSKQYADFKIKQAMEAYNRQQEALNQQKQEIERQLSPEEQANAAKEFYSKLGDNAKERAMKELGLSEEKLEELESYAHLNILSTHKTV